MNNLAIVKINGKQYLAKKGEHIFVDRINAEPGKSLKMSEILLASDGKNTTIGTPTIKGAFVQAKVISHPRGPKGQAFRYRPKKRIRKIKGYRANLTELEVTEIK